MQSRPNPSADARVFEAATRFFAALLGAGRVSETNQPGILRYCIRAAQQLVAELDGPQAPSPQPVVQSAAAADLDLDLELEELAKPEGTAYRSAQPASPPPGRPTPPGGVRR